MFDLVFYILGQLLIGISFPVVNVYSSIIWQSKVPPKLQGRVISVRMLITTLALPGMMLLTGIIGMQISFAVLFLVSTISFAGILLLVWLVTDFKLVDDHSPPIQQDIWTQGATTG